MFDWTELFYFELIVMRTSGFVLGSPFMGRSNVPNYVKAGIILVFSSFLFLIGDPSMVQPPSMLLELVFKLLVELLIGLILGFVLQLCMMTVQFAGEIIDTQMGLTMSQIYDASSQINMTVTGSLLNLLFVLNFFLENGHYTLLRIFLASEQVVAYGSTQISTEITAYVVEIFLSCIVVAVKLAMPILAAELMGEIGMGILMKAIPQINAFVINIELKIIIGMILLFVFLVPMNELILEIEADMLQTVRQGLLQFGS